MQIKAYLGLGSRYSYLAFTQLDRIATAMDVEIEQIPVNSVELIRRARTTGSPYDQSILEGQYSPEFRDVDARRWAAHYSVPYHHPRIAELPENALAIACWCLPDNEPRRLLINAIYNAVFVEGCNIDIEKLADIASEFGISQTELNQSLESGEAFDRHEQALENAHALGVFGVPTFIADDELFWGNDRLPLLEDYVSRVRQNSGS